MRISSITTTLFVLAAACTRSEAPPKKQPNSAPAVPAAPAPVAPAAPAAKAVDFSKVDKMIAAATKPEDFENIYGDCVTLGLQTMTAKNLDMKTVETDPDYWRHCKVDPSRAQVQVVLKQSKKERIGIACGIAAMNARHIADSGRPEAAEFKKLVTDMAKPCDL